MLQRPATLHPIKSLHFVHTVDVFRYLHRLCLEGCAVTRVWLPASHGGSPALISDQSILFCGGQSGIGKVFSPSTPMPHTHLNLITTVRRTSERSLGTFRQSSFFADIGEHWTQKCINKIFGLHAFKNVLTARSFQKTEQTGEYCSAGRCPNPR